MTLPVRVAAITRPQSIFNPQSARPVIAREMKHIDGLSLTMYTPEGLDFELETVPESAFGFAVVDGESIDNDFRTMPKAFRSKPNIYLVHQDTGGLDRLQDQMPLVDVRNVLCRPFQAGDLRRVAQRVMSELSREEPPSEGFYFDPSGLAAYVDGKPIEGMLSVDVDVLRFLHENGKATTPDNIATLFHARVRGVGDTEESALRILRTFGKRAGNFLQAATGGRYGVQIDEHPDGRLKFCRIVRMPGEKGPSI